MALAYIENPNDCRFEGQDDDEEILLLLRAHPITNLPWMLFSAIIFFIPFGLPFISKMLLLIGIDISVIPDTIMTAFLIINYLLVLIIVFEGFLYWYFNVHIITNHKVIDFDFESVLYKSVDLAPLAKIEETDSSVAGIIGTIFNFGKVTVQTAGATIAIQMVNVPEPSHVADLILDLSRRAGKKV